MVQILHDLIYLNYGVDGTILYLRHAECCPSTVGVAPIGDPRNPPSFL